MINSSEKSKNFSSRALRSPSPCSVGSSRQRLARNPVAVRLPKVTKVTKSNIKYHKRSTSLKKTINDTKQ